QNGKKLEGVNDEPITLADGYCARHRRGIGVGGALFRVVALPVNSGMTAWVCQRNNFPLTAPRAARARRRSHCSAGMSCRLHETGTTSIAICRSPCGPGPTTRVYSTI